MTSDEKSMIVKIILDGEVQKNTIMKHLKKKINITLNSQVAERLNAN